MNELSPDLLQEFKTLVEIVAKLRGPHGCPWDKDQTQKSLIQYAIEEAHELAEAIESGNSQSVKEELGDFLFQVILQAQVAQDENRFDLTDVIKGLNQKMVHRHPHVFGEEKAKSLEQIWQNWERLKAQEKNSSEEKPVFNYPKNLPALQAAHKIGVKTGNLKFDWNTPDEVFAKVEEEFAEMREALTQFKKTGSKNELNHEIGDLLFAIAQFSRHLGLESESCLREQNRRFQKRFSYVLKASGLSREDFVKMSSDKKEKLWQEAKLHLE